MNSDQETLVDPNNGDSQPELREVTAHIVDSEHKSAPETENGYPYIKTSDIENGRIDFDSVSYVDQQSYEEWTRRLKPEAGDIVLTREAPVGRVGLVPENKDICLGQRTVLIRPDPDSIDHQYLRYLLLSEEIQNKFESLSTGSTVDHLNLSDLRSLKLPTLPDLQTQKKIGLLLSNFDKKIEANEKSNEILEKMAKGIFENRFVNFSIYSNFKNTDCGEIPEGFVNGLLSDIAEIDHSRINPDESPDKIFNHFSFSAYDESSRPEEELGCEINSAKYDVEDESVLVSKLNPSIQRVWRVESAPDNSISSTEFVNLKPEQKNTLNFIYLLASSVDFKQYLESHTTGTSGSHQRVKQRDILDYPVAIPNDEELRRFDEIIQPICSKIQSNKIENGNLERFRDTLLPKLISGEIRVSGKNSDGLEVISEV